MPQAPLCAQISAQVRLSGVGADFGKNDDELIGA
jgi:hypothetical protein